MIADWVGEFYSTFIFVSFILLVCNWKKTEMLARSHNLFIWGAIALSLYITREFTNHSGGALNPAVTIGLEAFVSLIEGNTKFLKRSYIYLSS